MIGPLFALSSALAFALNNIFLRRAVLKVSDASIGILISVPMAVPLFFFILILTGQTAKILSFSWQEYVWLALAGVMTGALFGLSVFQDDQHFDVGHTMLAVKPDLVKMDEAKTDFMGSMEEVMTKIEQGMQVLSSGMHRGAGGGASAFRPVLAWDTAGPILGATTELRMASLKAGCRMGRLRP